MRRPVLIVAVSIAGWLLMAAPASAATKHVWPGESIQAAVNTASPGDTVLVHKGTYQQSVTIRKNHIRLIGKQATLLPPAKPSGFCYQLSKPDVIGICVLGKVNLATFEFGPRTVGTTVSGFTVKRFSGDGILLLNVADSSITHNTAAWNGAYGIAGFDQEGGEYLHNTVHNNHEPGLYLGDSPNANYEIAHNKAWGNSYGIFIRHSANGLVHHNELSGNCIGAFLLDDGQPEGFHDFSLWNNKVWANNKACGAVDGAPPLSGIGVLMLGTRHVTLHDNWITDNTPSGPSFVSGGLVMISAKQITGGSPVRNNTIRDNTITGNAPFDIFYDASGFNNRFIGNTCDTSQPAWICN
ncbi:MAG: hypothetical protein QOF68_2540 [Gaiellales bacterium]|nr:hypothetical protein [Gaiellales bacterium]